MTDMLSVDADLPRAMTLAARYGFGGVDASAKQLLAPDWNGSRIRDAMGTSHLRPGYIGLPPGRVPVSDADWQLALDSLPLIAERARMVGYQRAALVVLPFHQSLPFAAAFDEHVARLNAATAILDDFEIALALEYVAPLTRRAGYEHPFIHDMAGMLRLCEALESPRAGLLLDSFHWHCAGETTESIASLPAEKIVVVHINDAPDRPNDEQTVGDRALPGATGVIDLSGFVAALRATGYDGPVTCEPMASAVAAMPVKEAEGILSLTSAALKATL